MDCFRNYEATICGAIPVVAGCSKNEYADTFSYLGEPPWVFSETWEEALAVCKKLYATDFVWQARNRNTLWWWKLIRALQEMVRSALYDGRGVSPP
jgi:hypothetical protein